MCVCVKENEEAGREKNMNKKQFRKIKDGGVNVRDRSSQQITQEGFDNF